MYTTGVRNESDLYMLSIFMETLSLVMLVIAYVHSLLAESGFLSSLSITALEIAYTSPGYRVRDIASTTWISSVSNTRSLDLELSISLAILAQASVYLAQHFG